jgi:hypothetical protein
LKKKDMQKTHTKNKPAMALVAAIPPALMAIPSDLTHTHQDFERLISSISSRIDTQDSIQDQSSSALVVRQEMGYVYAAWNPLFPDLVKIGATMRAFPIMRVDELSSWAGVPEPFQLVASITAPDPFALERDIHKHFDSVRKYGRKKEFFLVTKEEIGYYFHVRSLQVQRGAGSAMAPKKGKKRSNTPSKIGLKQGGKRKHTKYFTTQEEELTFRSTFASFLKTHIEESEKEFLSTESIQTVFTEKTAQVPSDQIFWKNLSQHTKLQFPKATPGMKGDSRGYHGIRFK